MTDHQFLINLVGHSFDPLEEEPPLPDDLRTDEPSDETPKPYIVQFHESLTLEQRTNLQNRYGLSLADYIPELSYLEMISRARLTRLADDRIFRAAVPYHPGFKIGPDIGSHEFASEERRAEPGILVMVTAFANADRRELIRDLERLDHEIVSITDEPNAGILRLKVRIEQGDDCAQIARLSSVRSIEELGDITLNNGVTSWVIQSNVSNSRPIWDQGLRGEGQIVGHIDGQLDTAHCFFRDDVDNTPGAAHRKVVGVRNASSGSTSRAHGTFSAGCAAGEDVDNGANSANPNANNGNAPRARISHGYLYDLDWLSGTASFHNYLVQAHADGARIHTNSWDDKSSSAYTQLSVDLDKFAWENEDDLVIIGPDNNGTIRPPDTAKNALVVNATQQSPNQDSFASGIMQFTLDGRLKPEVMAPGQGIVSADDGTTCGTRTDSGTSFAAPAVAGAAALLRQYYTEGWYPTGTAQPHHSFTPSGALLKATLLAGAVDVTGIAGYPGAASSGEGWGRVLLENGLHFQGDARGLRVWDTRNADGLTTGITREHHIDVASNAEPLRVTLAWTEPPGAANSASPVVNDLNLEVVSPDGTQTFRGNVFSGGQSATGGTADALNNIEIVLVNAPAPGDWTLRVVGTAVNVGNPGQGYALVVTGDLEEAPAPLGQQDTLVVRAKFSDVAFEPPLPNLQNLMNEAADYIDEVSYGEASVAPRYRGPIELDHPKSYYYHPERSLLVELVEEVVAKLVAAEPGVFDGPTGDSADDIDRMVIVINDVNFTGDWATTGPWPYDLPAGITRPISVSVQSHANSSARFTHGLLHQFGLVDLYAHPHVVFPRPYVDEWDNMADRFTNVHPLVWSKERAGWVTAHGSTIEYITRPAAGTSYTGANPIRLFLQESTAVNRKAVALGLTQGAASIDQEKAFYFIEARSNSLGGFDDNLPESGVVVYYVSELIPQGQGPVIVRDEDLTTASLADAALDVGDTLTIPGTGITIAVQAGTGGAEYDINLTYAPPATDYNVRITRGDTINGNFYSYFSPDVWIDSPRNGFNLASGPPAHADRDNPVIGDVNRIYARIWNDGPATAFDFDVRFRISEPYHTVGGAPDFDTFIGIAHVDSLVAGASTNVYVEWTPADDGQSHACLLVDIINLVGTDTNPNDHEAQENLDKVTSVTSSPFHPVTYRYDLTNPYDYPALFYFRAEGVPAGWEVVLSPRKILLNPAERVAGIATITPLRDGEVCTSELLQVTSWTPRGDTMINVGGGVVQVDLRRLTTLTLEGGIDECRDEDLERLFERVREQGDTGRVRVLWERLASRAKEDGVDAHDIERTWNLLYGRAAEQGRLIEASAILQDWRLVYTPADRDRPEPEDPFRNCGRITATGCTDPPRPHEEITVKFADPAGNVEYVVVKTDEHGCFEAFIVTVDEGIWKMEAEYPGNECDAPATSPPRVVCFCPGGTHQEG